MSAGGSTVRRGDQAKKGKVKMSMHEETHFIRRSSQDEAKLKRAGQTQHGCVIGESKVLWSKALYSADINSTREHTRSGVAVACLSTCSYHLPTALYWTVSVCARGTR